MEKMIECTCETCGIKYEKPLQWKIWNDNRPQVFFKWSLSFCDEHRREKELKALKSLPTILKSLSK